jgi:hypothetical protein
MPDGCLFIIGKIARHKSMIYCRDSYSGYHAESAESQCVDPHDSFARINSCPKSKLESGVNLVRNALAPLRDAYL